MAGAPALKNEWNLQQSRKLIQPTAQRVRHFTAGSKVGITNLRLSGVTNGNIWGVHDLDTRHLDNIICLSRQPVERLWFPGSLTCARKIFCLEHPPVSGAPIKTHFFRPGERIISPTERKSAFCASSGNLRPISSHQKSLPAHPEAVPF